MCAAGLSFRRSHPLQQDQEDRYWQRRLCLQALLQGLRFPQDSSLTLLTHRVRASLMDLCTFSPTDQRRWNDAPLKRGRFVL